MRRRRSTTGESIITFLTNFDYDHPPNRDVLKHVLGHLQEVLMASREQLERHLRLFPKALLQEAWEKAQSREEIQFPLVFPTVAAPASAENTPAFQAAERPGEYLTTRSVTVDEVFEFVRQELEKRFFRAAALTSPKDTKRYLIAQLAREEREIFAALFLDTRHRPLAFDRLFFGTIDGCSVHPREVVKRALHHNAAAVIFCHNHPSGAPEPSAADRSITTKLQDALAIVDVKVLDHIIVGGTETVSFAEQGLL